MDKREICSKLEETLSPVISSLNYELVHIDYLKENKRWILRIYIDKEGGISLNDCQAASEIIGKHLDDINLIEDSYFLEVCSPGLDRPLVKEKDFIKFQGKTIHVKTKEPVDNRKNFTGIIKELKEKNLILELTETADVFSIPLNNIKKANLVIEI